MKNMPWRDQKIYRGCLVPATATAQMKDATVIAPAIWLLLQYWQQQLFSSVNCCHDCGACGSAIDGVWLGESGKQTSP